MRTRRTVRRLPLHLAAALTIVICLFPVYWMITTSFKPNRDSSPSTLNFSRRPGHSTTSSERSMRKASGCSGATASW